MLTLAPVRHFPGVGCFVSPLTTVMAATLDFFFSRGLAFKDKQNLNLFNIVGRVFY